MSLLTGLKTGTSRSMLNGSCARNLVFTTVRSQARSASTVQEVQEEYRDYEQRMKKAQQVPTRNNQGRRMSPEHVMRRDIDMNMLVVPSLDYMVYPPLKIWSLFPLKNLTVSPKAISDGLNSRWKWFGEWFSRQRDTAQNLRSLSESGVFDRTPHHEISKWSFFRRWFRLQLPSNMHLSYLPLARHALDVYTSYQHSQATRDFPTIDSTSVGESRVAAKAIASSGKVREWGYTEPPNVPRIAYLRVTDIGVANLSILQMCCVFDTKQYIKIREKVDGKFVEKTKTQHVKENIIFNRFQPDDGGQGWLISGRRKTTPPPFGLSQAEKDDLQRYIDEETRKMEASMRAPEPKTAK